jgi:hypothetical protein
VTRSDDLGRVASVVLKLGVQGVRHAVRVHRDAVREFLIKAQQPHRKRADAEIGEPEIGCDCGGDARHVGG